MSWISYSRTIQLDPGGQSATSDAMQAEWAASGLVVDVDVTGPTLRGSLTVPGTADCKIRYASVLAADKVLPAKAPVDSRAVS